MMQLVTSHGRESTPARKASFLVLKTNCVAPYVVGSLILVIDGLVHGQHHISHDVKLSTS